MSSIAIARLPLAELAFSDDTNARAEFQAVLLELHRISGASHSAADGKGIVSFRKALEHLGITVRAGITEVEAAAEFLRQAEKVCSTLNQLRSALEKGSWDWGKAEGFSWGGWRLLNMLETSSIAMSGIVQAHWLARDASEAWRAWEMTELLAVRAGDSVGTTGASIVQANIQFRRVQIVNAGLSLGGWTDEQLARIPQSLASYDALAALHRELTIGKGYWEALSQRPDSIRTAMLQQGANALGRLTISLMPDQQLKDNVALRAADHDYAIAQFDFKKRQYIPPDVTIPSLEARTEKSVLAEFYFLPFSFLGSNSKEENYPIATLPTQAIHRQVETDHGKHSTRPHLIRRALGGRVWQGWIDAQETSEGKGASRGVAAT